MWCALNRVEARGVSRTSLVYGARLWYVLFRLFSFMLFCCFVRSCILSSPSCSLVSLFHCPLVPFFHSIPFVQTSLCLFPLPFCLFPLPFCLFPLPFCLFSLSLRLFPLSLCFFVHLSLCIFVRLRSFARSGFV